MADRIPVDVFEAATQPGELLHLLGEQRTRSLLNDESMLAHADQDTDSWSEPGGFEQRARDLQRPIFLDDQAIAFHRCW